MKFNIGDHVIGEGWMDEQDITGLVGKVVAFEDRSSWSSAPDLYGIAFEEYREDFHDVGGHAENGYGWYVFAESLRLLGGLENE